MRVLYVAYSLLPVTEASAGGAEQMLLTLEREMARRGHHTAVAACAGSRIHGELVPTGSTPEQPDQFESRAAEHHRRVLEHLCSPEARYDLLHDKSGSFWRVAGGTPFPVLATLHLPRSFHGDGWFNDRPANVYFNCVSCAQAATFANLPRMLGVVRNGIAVEKFALTPRKREYLLWLGRFCEEKGAHIAIDVARRAGRALVLAGQVYPFSYHQRYYDEQIRPHLQPRPGHAGSQVVLVDTPSLQEKLELLSHAHCLLAPSLCDETSSLVALEAMACGTPVIAFRRGGIPEVVADGETGFVVDSVEEMSEAVERAGKIRPEACRTRVEREFSAQRMADNYEELYDFVSKISH